jgi:hypothetical protein
MEVPVSTAAARESLPAPVTGRVKLPVLAIADGQIIPTGIGNVVSSGGGDAPWIRYGLLTTLADELPVSGARLFQVGDGGPGVTTDGAGAFSLPVSAGERNLLLQALFRSPDGRKGFRLLAIARAGGDVEVSWRSTVVAEGYIAPDGSVSPDLSQLDPTSLPAREQQVAAATSSDSARAELFARALEVAPEAVTGTGTQLVAPVSLPRPVPSDLPAQAPAGATNAVPRAVTSDVPEALASGVPAVLNSTVPRVTGSSIPPIVSSTVPGIVASTIPQVVTSTVPQVVTSTVPQVVGSTVPQLVGQVLNVLPTPSASPRIKLPLF